MKHTGREPEVLKPPGHDGLWRSEWTPTVGHLSVADVLQVGHGVVVAHFSARLEFLQPLRRLPRR